MANIASTTHFTGGVNQIVTPIIGGSAGDHTLTGITTDDKLQKVYDVAFGGGVPTAVADLTSEFSISAANTINNTGGTASTYLIVTWVDVDFS
jgi:hypothetical protein